MLRVLPGLIMVLTLVLFCPYGTFGNSSLGLKAHAEGAANDITQSAVTGFPYGYTGQSYGNLFDGDTGTKWCMDVYDYSIFVVFKTSEPVRVTKYSVATADDMTIYPDRNPFGWTLSACRDYAEENTSWTVIDTRKNSPLPLQDEVSVDFQLAEPTPFYQYFKLEFQLNKSSYETILTNEIQISELTLDYIKCEHASEAAGKTYAPTCTKDGYTLWTCSVCGRERKADIQPALGHNFSNGFCTRCNAGDSTLREPLQDENGVYQIGSAGELYWFANHVNSGNTSANAVLTANIKVNDDVLDAKGNPVEGSYKEWTPIGSIGQVYAGTFDGQGFTVSGLYFKDEAAENVGLFGTTAYSANIKNVGVVDSYFHGSGTVGGICGYNGGEITNCYNTGTVCGLGTVGGICGKNIAGRITDCFNTGKIKGIVCQSGGVCGYNTGTITNCYYLDGCNAYGTAFFGNLGTSKTAEQFAAGEVCYLLNGGKTYYTVWHQNTDRGTADSHPVLDSTHGTVYKSPCSGNYSNTYSYHTVSGAYTNGFGRCSVCGSEMFMPAEDTDNDLCYEIGNAGQLYWFAQQVNSGNSSAKAVLTADITVNRNVLKADGTPNSQSFRDWTPMNGFAGSFDGQGHTISGLYCDNQVIGGLTLDNEATVIVGLFGKNAGHISNLGVVDSYFKGRDFTYVGGICGFNAGGTIESCYYSGTVTDAGDYVHVGGICGRSEGGTIESCYNLGTITDTGEYGYCGGICGRSTASIKNCYNTGAVNGIWCVGGVSGDNEGCSITNSYNTGRVSGSYGVGGVSGLNESEMTNCYNTGSVSGESEVGGVSGDNHYGTITNCYHTGSVSGETAVGGVNGNNYLGTISNCYFDSTVYNGSAVGTNDRGTVTDVEGKTTVQFAGGEVCYYLSWGPDGSVWGQSLGTDTYPAFGGRKVYVSESCTGYSNTENYIRKHPYENGVCTSCGADQPPVFNEADGRYEIFTVEQLYWFAGLVNGDPDICRYGVTQNAAANAVLTADLTVNASVLTAPREWKPIGYYNSESDISIYTGTFDGQGHTISGLYYKGTDIKDVGLFGYIGAGGKISNVVVADSYFDFQGSSKVGDAHVGGVCGYNAGGTITDCHYAGAAYARGDSSCAGGVCGYNAGTVTGCHNTGTIAATSNNNSYAGGVCGYSTGTITGCHNTGTIAATSNNDSYAGGVCGYSTGTIKNSYNIGAVTGCSHSGGVCGYNTGAITCSYNTGAVGEDGYVGGVCGTNYQGTITNCHSTGTLSGTFWDVGGVCGYNYQEAIANCYFDSTVYSGDAIGLNSSLLVTDVKGKTTEQFVSGEVAYLLSQGCTVQTVTYDGSVWGQRIGTELYPVLGGARVYLVSNCVGYANTPTKEHNYDNGFCIYCGKPVPPEYKTEKPVFNATENRYEIHNADQLYWFAGLVNGTLEGVTQNNAANAVLKADIIVKEGVLTESGELNPELIYPRVWKPIGDPYNKYTGTFDGNNHTISGLYLNASVSYAGLFGYVEGGSILDVGVVDSYFNVYGRSGGVCGHNEGGTIKNCYYMGIVSGTFSDVGGVCGYGNGGTIENCYNTGTVSGLDYVGGVCGYNKQATIKNCYHTGDVTTTGDSAYVGGVCGYSEGGAIESCHHIGDVTAGSSGRAGGVSGYNSSTITNCYNTGAVTTGKSGWAGGVCGDSEGGTIENCYNTGAVTAGSSGYAGGVSGYNYGTITNCYNTGAVTAGSSGRAGGVSGDNSSTIANCYNTGAVDADSKGYAGGVSGSNYGTITNCYNTGAVTAGSSGRAGGVCGHSTGTITNCYNTGAVTVGKGNSKGYSYAGGVSGYNTGFITNCYHTGAVTGAGTSSSYRRGVCANNTGTIANCYHDSTFFSGNAVRGTGGTATNVLGKTTDQFASGEVAYLLSQGCTVGGVTYDGSVWGQTLTGESMQTYPVLGGATVYQNKTYTGCMGNPGDPAVAYSNTEADPVYAEHEDADGNGICEICSKPVRCAVKAVSATLNGDIGLNYYIALPEAVTADTGAYVQFTVNGQDTRVLVSELTAGEDGTYKLTCWLTAKEMRDTVTFALYDGSGAKIDIYENSGNQIEGASFDYSLEEYFDTLSSEEDAGLKALSDATLLYGAYAQNVFSHNADPTLDGSELADVTVDTLAGSRITKSADIPAGLRFTEMTLILEAETTFRLYFRTDAIEAYTFMLDGEQVTPKLIAAEDLYYIAVTNISAKDLDTMHTLEIKGECTLTFNALSYAYAALKDGKNEAVCNVVRALYKYNEAANAYFRNE